MGDTGNLAYGGFQRSYSFGFFHADKIPNSTGGAQCPAMECEQVYLQNDPNSSGNSVIGDGGTLPITGNGFVLKPGDVTGWIPLKNLNLIWHKDAANSTLNYMVIR